MLVKAYISFSAVQARLSESSYSVSEDEDVIETVCVELDGMIARNFELELSTVDGTATGIVRHLSRL